VRVREREREREKESRSPYVCTRVYMRTHSIEKTFYREHIPCLCTGLHARAHGCDCEMEAYIRTYTHMHPHFKCMLSCWHGTRGQGELAEEIERLRLEQESKTGKDSEMVLLYRTHSIENTFSTYIYHSWNKRVRLARTPKWCTCMHKDILQRTHSIENTFYREHILYL
jgi:hypothetical protein